MAALLMETARVEVHDADQVACPKRGGRTSYGYLKNRGICSGCTLRAFKIRRRALAVMNDGDLSWAYRFRLAASILRELDDLQVSP